MHMDSILNAKMPPDNQDCTSTLTGRDPMSFALLSFRPIFSSSSSPSLVRRLFDLSSLPAEPDLENNQSYIKDNLIEAIIPSPEIMRSKQTN